MVNILNFEPFVTRVTSKDATVNQSKFLFGISDAIFLVSSNLKKFISVKTKGKDANGRPSILGHEEIEVPPQYRMMASDVSIDTRKFVFSQSEY